MELCFHDPRPTTHDPRPTTHDPRPTYRVTLHSSISSGVFDISARNASAFRYGLSGSRRAAIGKLSGEVSNGYGSSLIDSSPTLLIFSVPVEPSGYGSGAISPSAASRHANCNWSRSHTWSSR